MDLEEGSEGHLPSPPPQMGGWGSEGGGAGHTEKGFLIADSLH
jgi:hypothetical protein